MILIIKRVYDGVADHFPIRWLEWLMAWPAFGMWLALQADPVMFEKSPSFNSLQDYAEETTWAMIFGAVVVLRLFALTINGTFKSFSFSPHIRALAAVVGALVWSQVSLGFASAAWSHGGALSGAIGWSVMVIIEVANVLRSWDDVGKHWTKRSRQRV